MIDVRQLVEMHRATVVRLARRTDQQSLSRFSGSRLPAAQFQLLALARGGSRSQPRSLRQRDCRRQTGNRWLQPTAQRRHRKTRRLARRAIAQSAVVHQPLRALNTETPGSTIDRLSILSLRIYHMEEQANRTDANLGHRAKARSRLEILVRQHHDLAQALTELVDDIFAGRKRLEVYRQFKMYNDPTLNPYLYAAGEKNRVAGMIAPAGRSARINRVRLAVISTTRLPALLAVPTLLPLWAVPAGALSEPGGPTGRKGCQAPDYRWFWPKTIRVRRRGQADWGSGRTVPEG